MRACSGHLDRPRRRQRRPRGGRRERPRAGASRQPLLPDPPRLAHEGGGSGLLLRLRQRGPVAAVPHRAHAAGVPRGRLGALPRGEPALRRDGRVGIAHAQPDRPRAGLPLRAAAADDPRDGCPRPRSSPSGTSRGPTRRPSASARGARNCCDGLLGSSILGFHTQFHCNNFFDTVDRYLEARVDRETFTISYGGEPTEVHRYPISIEWPLAGAREPAARARSAAGRSASSWGSRPTRSWAWAWTASTTPRASWSASPPSSASSSWSPRGSAASRSSRSPRPAAPASTSTSPSTRACAPRRSASTSRFAVAGLPADHPQDRAPRRRSASTRTTGPPTSASSRACTTA